MLSIDDSDWVCKRKWLTSSPEIMRLYYGLEKVNTFSNTRMAYVETKFNQAEEAWASMKIWLRTLNQNGRDVE